MAISIKRYSGQGIQVGDVWIYVKKDRFSSQIKVIIIAPKDQAIAREEVADVKGPFYDPALYQPRVHPSQKSYEDKKPLDPSPRFVPPKE